MVRPYPHRPDEVFATRRFPIARDGVARVGATIARTPDAHEGIANSGGDHVLEAMAWGWLLEVEQPAQLRQLLDSAKAFVRHGLAHPRGEHPSLSSAGRWIALALIAGDPQLAARVGASVAPARPAQPGEEFLVMLAALARGDDASAAAWADALTRVLGDPGTAPFAAAGLAHLDELGRAVLARDQAALDAAARARGEAIAAEYRRTAEKRRQWIPVLDHYAAAVVLLGVQRGLAFPPGIASLPAELLLAR
jgi:hypothetical protein